MACMENRKQKPKGNIEGLLDLWRDQMTTDNVYWPQGTWLHRALEQCQQYQHRDKEGEQ